MCIRDSTSPDQKQVSKTSFISKRSLQVNRSVRKNNAFFSLWAKNDGANRKKNFNSQKKLEKWIDYQVRHWVFYPIAVSYTHLDVYKRQMLICLFTRFPHMLLLIVIMAGKELYMAVSGCLVIRKTGKVHGADWHGKIVTFLLYGTAAVHIIWFHITPMVSDLLIGLRCV